MTKARGAKCDDACEDGSFEVSRTEDNNDIYEDGSFKASKNEDSYEDGGFEASKTMTVKP